MVKCNSEEMNFFTLNLMYFFSLEEGAQGSGC